MGKAVILQVTLFPGFLGSLWTIGNVFACSSGQSTHWVHMQVYVRLTFQWFTAPCYGPVMYISVYVYVCIIRGAARWKQ